MPHLYVDIGRRFALTAVSAASDIIKWKPRRIAARLQHGSFVQPLAQPALVARDDDLVGGVGREHGGVNNQASRAICLFGD